MERENVVSMPRKIERLVIQSREMGLRAIVGAAPIGWMNTKTASMWAVELWDADAEEIVLVVRCVSRDQAIVKGMEFVFGMSEAEMMGQPASVEVGQ